MSSPRIHSVSELTQVIKRTLENSFPYVWVKGEVTNLSRAGSGHIYFSLKDENALLPCVWYKNQQKDLTFDPITGEVFDEPIPSLAHNLQQGMEMLFAGSLNVYPPRGAYQFIVDRAEEIGKGNLHKAFEALKKKLYALGWFNQEHKKELPKNPKRVAVLTSPQGAVIHDFCRISKQYGLSSSIRIYPIAVQGSEAVMTITKAFKKVHDDNWAEVIVLIRGGGSLEDLWAFNEEEVARSIFESEIPVITGIGHQVDVSISDFVADKSAATPSHVVSHLWKEKQIYVQYIDEIEENLNELIDAQISNKSNQLQIALRNLNLLSPEKRLSMQAENLSIKLQRLHASARFIKEKERAFQYQLQKFLPLAERNLYEKKSQLENAKSLLSAHNPYMPLEKGYALVHKKNEQGNEELIRSSQTIENNTQIILEFKDGKTILEAQKVQQINKDSNS